MKCDHLLTLLGKPAKIYNLQRCLNFYSLNSVHKIYKIPIYKLFLRGKASHLRLQTLFPCDKNLILHSTLESASKL